MKRVFAIAKRNLLLNLLCTYSNFNPWCREVKEFIDVADITAYQPYSALLTRATQPYSALLTRAYQPGSTLIIRAYHAYTEVEV